MTNEKRLKKKVAKTHEKRKKEIFEYAAYGDLGKIKKLLDFGIDVNTRDEGGYTMLHWATQEGHLEVIRFLISRGSSIHLEDEEGFTPLYIASGEGYIEIIEWLIKNGADIEVKSNDGVTPLMIACCYDHKKSLNYY
ncbi:ankyrin repeat domain-containing protein [Priestia megaterium]